MKRMLYRTIAILGMAIGLGVVNASGPIAVFTLIDKVVFEPNAEKPERIRLSGVFIAATPNSDVYSAPQRGYLYLALPSQYADLALREWSDLKTIAGTRQVVGLGTTWSAKVRVRKSEEEAKSPDEYPLGNGVVKLNADHPRAKAILDYK